MGECVVKVCNLEKRYGKERVLDNISMNIRKGDIYGLIGENGAGKSTILKVLMGLDLYSSGEILLFGDGSKNGVLEGRKRSSALIEAPNLFTNMTAIENLELVRIQRGVPGEKCIDNVLYSVGLKKEDLIKKKVKKLSLGTKQRVGIAMALLSEPEFLILDEPLNGLDPIGIKELREMLLRLNRDKGITILIASHILMELSQIATRFGFLSHGKMIEEISFEELKEKCRNYIQVKMSKTSEAVVVLESLYTELDYEVISDNVIRIYSELEVEEIIFQLSMHNIRVQEVIPVSESLENYYAKMIGGIE